MAFWQVTFVTQNSLMTWRLASMYYCPMLLFTVKAIIIVTDKKIRIDFKHSVQCNLSELIDTRF